MWVCVCLSILLITSPGDAQIILFFIWVICLKILWWCKQRDLRYDWSIYRLHHSQKAMADGSSNKCIWAANENNNVWLLAARENADICKFNRCVFLKTE